VSTVIELDGVSKRYRLGEHHGGQSDLREALAALARRLRHRSAPARQVIWSLRDITLRADEGTSLGIIGANGAGKSTLLKVICSITTPTEGRCRTRGRVGSLLEVGTGFHGDLTGLENTYLNGAILGMTRREVSRRLDEIVAFAGLEAFMDTPVKRYSSGMYLRLGFAIAAHMEAEILLVDEVLAVGDAEFQRRCLGKMSEVERSGRTVLFVSHNMEAITRLCDSAVWLERGRIREIGPTRGVVGQYLRSAAQPSREVAIAADPTASAQVLTIALIDDRGRPQSIFTTEDELRIRLEVVVNEVVTGLSVSCLVGTRTGVDLVEEGFADADLRELARPGRYRVTCVLPPVLTPGEYSLTVWLGSAYENLELHEDIVAFAIDGDDLGRHRLVRVGAAWKTERIDDHLGGQ
jgi:ABC-2 type transport system ATP-binding protein/lipopolysaccharide transport system ATP-binding protein